MRVELEQLRVKNACPKTWQELQGHGSTRYCDDCGLHVHNLSVMDRSEVDLLVGTSTGRMCVAYVPAMDGNPRTLDYQQPTSLDRNRRRWIWGGSLVAILVAAFQAIAFERKPPAPVMLMGDVGPLPRNLPISPASRVGAVCPPTTEPSVLGDISAPMPPSTRPGS